MSLEKFYGFAENTLYHGWTVYLTSDFRAALDDMEHLASFSGWNPGDPLPAIPAVYQGEPVVSLAGIFDHCRHVQSLDLTQWDTSNVRDMSRMFFCCDQLQKIKASFNTSKVLDMSRMFSGCESLSSLDVSDWDVSQVFDMFGMFSHCSNLRQLDVSAWDVGSVTNMSDMFWDCKTLSSLDVSKWDTHQVLDMARMFLSCERLTYLDVSHWDTSLVERMNSMFSGCERLMAVDVSSFQTGRLIYAGRMFHGCESLRVLDLHAWNVQKLTDAVDMFDCCSNLICLDLSEWNPSSMKRWIPLIERCCSLKAVYMSDSMCDVFGQFASLKSKVKKKPVVVQPVLDQYPVPDPDLTTADMKQYGYLCDGMLPVGQDVAMELYLAGYPVHTLYPNDTEGMIIDKGEILAHDGLFGVFRKDWELGPRFYHRVYDRKLHQWKREQALLAYPDDCFAIYQVSNKDAQNLRFMNLDWIRSKGFFVQRSNYDLVYTAPLYETCDVNEQLEVLYRVFNLEKPVDFCCPSMSVSDVVALKRNGKISFYYCDSIGFVEISGFLPDDPICASVDRALFQHDVEPWETDWFYHFVPVEGGLKAELAPEFRSMLDREEPMPFVGWDPSEPLPPLPSMYHGERVVSVSGLFAGCKYVRSLDLTLVDLLHVQDMSRIFFDCSSLESVIWFSRPNCLLDFSYAFAGCANLKKLELSNLSFQNIRDISYAFWDCTSLVSLKFSVRARFLSPVCFRGIFQNCYSLLDLDIHNWDIHGGSNLADMFRGCSSLVWERNKLGKTISEWDVCCGPALVGMFEDCESLTFLDLSKWDVREVGSLNRMFAGCGNLKYLNISTWRPKRTVTMARMFENCESLPSLDISKWNILKCTDVTDAFSGCDALKQICVRSERVKVRLAASGVPESMLVCS